MQINFSDYPFNIKYENSKALIFDIVRKKFVTLTPEESTRQNWIHYLIHDKKFPRSLLAIEMNIVLNQMQKRCDIVAYDKYTKPVLIVECKSTKIKITQEVFEQIARYNLTLRVKYLVVSNGLNHIACEMNYEKEAYSFIDDLPPYDSLNLKG